MRLVATFESLADAKAIHVHLAKMQIASQMDETESQFDIWVLNEDNVALASKLIATYREKGEKAFDEFPVSQTQHDIPTDELFEKKSSAEEDDDDDEQKPLEEVVLKQVPPPAKVSFFGGVTRVILVICSIFYFVSAYQTSTLVKSNKISANLPVLTEVNQLFLYDYPPVLSAISKLIDLELARQDAAEISSETSSEDPKEEGVKKELPPRTPEELALIKEIETTPIWIGFYNLCLNYSKRDILLTAPMFTSILHGEVWRIFTPIFLHAGILHFFFNMLWLWLLGKMVEGNMSTISFILFILIAAAFTNTCQYLMTGPFFMGISGVLTALAGYIWSRKKIAPWEIYPVDRGTLVFLACFVFGLLGLQIVAFYLQLVHNSAIPLNFANTAHVSGVFLGLLLGRTTLFQRKI